MYNITLDHPNACIQLNLCTSILRVWGIETRTTCVHCDVVCFYRSSSLSMGQGHLSLLDLITNLGF